VSTLGVIASVIAAIASVTTLVVGIRRARHGRLIEIVDLLSELKAAIDYGGYIPGPKGKLQARIGRMDPATRTVLAAPLRTNTESSDLATAALEEARTALARSADRRLWLRRGPK
jgi:hypothetical protein